MSKESKTRKSDKKTKICLACSSGGHLTQMLQLEPLYEKYEHFMITEDTVISRSLNGIGNSYYVKLVNRRQFQFPFVLIANSIKVFGVLLKERPSVIISTGALNAVPVCYIAKLMGSQIIFIESFAKVHEPTLSGRLVSRIADLFIVQWETMLHFYPKAVYGGSIY